jgi:hypothetical protein
MQITIKLIDNTIVSHEIPEGSRKLEGKPYYPGANPRGTIRFQGDHLGYAAGTQRFISPNNTIYTFSPSGGVMRQYDNGTFYHVHRDNRARKRLADGTWYSITSNGIITRTTFDKTNPNALHEIAEKIPGRPITRKKYSSVPAESRPT